MSGHEILGLGLILYALGIFTGHAVGYVRAIDMMRRRIRRRATYRRVGRSE